MIDDILLFFDGIYVQYDSLIWPILFVSIGEYFLFIRLFGKHENCIVTPKRTNKEENKIISEKIRETRGRFCCLQMTQIEHRMWHYGR